MNKKLLPSLLTMFFLAFMMIAGIAQVLTDLKLYGWTYTITTIVSGIATVKTVYVGFEFVSIGFLFWVFMICYHNYRLINRESINDKTKEL